MRNIVMRFRRFHDEYQYHIPEKVIKDSENVLCEYASFRPSHEGIVYWAGIREKNISTVLLVVAPRAESHQGGILVSHNANFQFVKALSKRNMVQIGQVHTHPTRWVGHSFGDDRNAAFKVNGLLSVVVPNYCREGMKALKYCGVHRFEAEGFIQLPTSYIHRHFYFRDDFSSDFEDLR